MSLDLWLEYVLRFSHLVAGISWIGSSFYFIWLDSSFLPPETPLHNVEGEVFMVHGGYYYQVKKRKFSPTGIPKTLHWFKWEATLTFITGLSLFVYLYYLKGARLLINPNVFNLSQTQAISLSLFMMIASWFIYDFIWSAKIFRAQLVRVLVTLCYFCAAIYLATQFFSGRGAYMVIGAIFGTAMLLNVWVRILPGQAKMLNKAKEGLDPDHLVGKRSKLRSVHNTYFIFPVLFIMLSNHYPVVYNHQYNWLLLIVLAFSGAFARHGLVTQRARERWVFLPAGIGFMALVFMTAQAPSSQKIIQGRVDYLKIKPIIQARCLRCHSTKNSDETFDEAPNGILFETESQILDYREKIIEQVIVAKTMPLNNVTNITEEERGIIKKYFSDR